MVCANLIVRFDPHSTVTQAHATLREVCETECGQQCWDDYDHPTLTDLEQRCNRPSALTRWQDRALVVFCRDVDAETLAILASQPDQPPLVLSAIASSENTPGEVLWTLASRLLRDGPDEVLELVAAHRNLTPHLAERMWTELERGGRWARSLTFEALAGNHATPAEVLTNLALCVRKDVRDIVADHPRTHDDQTLSAVVEMVENDSRYLVDRTRLWLDIDNRLYERGDSGLL